MEIKKYFGPPGTGKTTRLVQDVMAEIERGIPIERIAYVAYTRAAAQEVRARLVDAGFQADQLQFFGTIHSMCYHLLGIHKGQVLNESHIKRFRERKHYKLSVKGKLLDDDMPVLEGAGIPFQPNHSADDVVFWAYSQLRVRQWGSSRVSSLPFTDFQDMEYVKDTIDDFHRDYEAFKKENDIVDFTDMLELAINNLLHLPVDVLFLDEAQDLYPLQWSVFEMWRERGQPKRVRLAGDDDQCIYNWAGAEPGTFIRYPGEDEVLKKSYRLPVTIARKARRFIEQNKFRKAKDWHPVTDRQGRIQEDVHASFLMEFLLAHPEKTVFLLTRAKFLLSYIAAHLQRMGLPYYNLRGSSPMATNKRWAFLAVKKNNFQYTAKDLRYLTEYVPSVGYWRRGAKTKIKNQLKDDARNGIERLYSLEDLQALGATPLLLSALQQHDDEILTGNKFGAEERGYYSKVYRKFGEKSFREAPRITLGTMHAVKGKEADIVALWPDITKKIRAATQYQEGAEAERRVWYVGMTRAREQLWLMRPIRDGYIYSGGV